MSDVQVSMGVREATVLPFGGDCSLGVDTDGAAG